MAKGDRQKAILSIIAEKNIDTQEMLSAELRARGFDTTQATVSRDINELGLRKVQSSTGTKYISNSGASYEGILSSGITSMTVAGNLVVVKTISGVAMAVAAAIDNMKIDGVVGCIAGDDTIFIAVSSAEKTEHVIMTIGKGKQ